MNDPQPKPGTRGPLIILSGPSGTGKSTLVHRLLDMKRWPLRLSVSATTRAPRPGEVEGRDYYFWTREQFEEALSKAEFLEHAQVHGKYYGTLRREVEPYRQAGWGVILDIDTQGARQVWQACSDHVSIFVRTSEGETYEERLRKRGTETEAAIRQRLQNAQAELSHAPEYPYQILNEDLDEAVEKLAEVVATCFPKGP
ncbi:MAG: guanylate kinase [Gemmataceae bacterium]